MMHASAHDEKAKLWQKAADQARGNGRWHAARAYQAVANAHRNASDTHQIASDFNHFAASIEGGGQGIGSKESSASYHAARASEGAAQAEHDFANSYAAEWPEGTKD